MKTSNITLKDLAKILNVSISAVSKSLSDSNEISDNTKKKVIKIADLLKYRPNFHASGLKNNNSFIIGVILPTLKDDFFLEALNGITEESALHDYKVMMYQSCNDYNKEKMFSNLLHESNIIDGLIFSSTKRKFVSNGDEHINNFISKGLPIIFLNKKYDSHNVSSVYGNAFEVGRDCAKTLIEQIEAPRLANSV